MDNAVSKPSDAVPFNFGKAIFKFLGKTVCSFADDFKIADHGIYCLTVFCKIFKILSGCVVKDPVGTFQYVTDQKLGSRLDIDDLPLYCLEIVVLNASSGYQVYLFLEALFDVLG